jgi:hypothetical protein
LGKLKGMPAGSCELTKLSVMQRLSTAPAKFWCAKAPDATDQACHGWGEDVLVDSQWPKSGELQVQCWLAARVSSVL